MGCVVNLGPTLTFLLTAFASFAPSLHSGEIDIMEHVNVENVTVGTVHFGGTTSQNYVNCYKSSGERGCSDRVEGSWSHQALVALKSGAG